MTPLEELRAVHEQQRALVLGHWTEEYIGRAVRDMEQKEAQIERLRGALQRIKDSDGRFDTVHEIASDALEQLTSGGDE